MYRKVLIAGKIDSYSNGKNSRQGNNSTKGKRKENINGQFYWVPSEQLFNKSEEKTVAEGAQNVHGLV